MTPLEYVKNSAFFKFICIDLTKYVKSVFKPPAPLTLTLSLAACDDHLFFLVKKDTLETVGKQEKDLCLFID